MDSQRNWQLSTDIKVFPLPLSTGVDYHARTTHNRVGDADDQKEINASGGGKERAAGMRHGEVVQVGVDNLNVAPCHYPPTDMRGRILWSER
jgi:hypothetical protein